MTFRDDERGAAIQVGAAVLLGFVVLAFTLYQVNVVPDQNRATEIEHNRQVQADLAAVRNGVVSVPGGGAGRSVSVEVGTTYPNRALFLNPPPVTGSLRTTDSAPVRVTNATAAGETGDYWNGSTRTFPTRALRYRASYSEFDAAPTTLYENTVLYDRYDGRTVTRSEQLLVDGRTITVPALNGSYQAGSTGTTTVDLRAASASANVVTVSDPDGITLTVPTRLSAATWRDLLADEFAPGGNVVGVSPAGSAGGVDLVNVSLAGGVDYRLRTAKVGVGDGVTEDTVAYLTDRRGDDRTVAVGETTRLVVEARDRFDNPVAGESVSATVVAGGGSVAPAEPGESRTDADGLAVFEYAAPSTTGTATVRASVGATAATNVSFDLAVTSSGGGDGGSAFAVEWLDATGPGVNCGDDRCTVDATVAPAPRFRVNTTPVAQGATVEYAVNDTSVATVDPAVGATDAAGENATTLTTRGNGVVRLYAAAGGDGDTLTVEVVNAGATAFTPLVEDFEAGSLAGTNFSSSGTGDAGLRADDTVVDGGDVGVVSASPTRGAYVENSDTDNALVSRTVDTESLPAVRVEYAVKQGDDGSTPENEPDTDEDLLVEYQRPDGTWATVRRLDADDTDGRYRAFATELTAADARHGDFRLRFRQPGATSRDPWYVDDVCVVAATRSCGRVGLGDGTAANVDEPGPGNGGTFSGLRFSVTNDRSSAVELSRVAVRVDDPAASTLREEFPGKRGEWTSEVYVTTDGRDGYAETSGSFPVGNDRTDLGRAATIPAGTTATVRLSVVRDGGGDEYDLRGRRVTITLVTDGVDRTTVVEVTDSEPVSR
jgi:hypothetical protein